ncbi:unnamed protein product [Orchesella dallaii]|uniref:SANT domain-containing protein n=1 Tax=Orchesella dallaii TaxID=48710 RepID=A0ABP1PZJ8_9HEXA
MGKRKRSGSFSKYDDGAKRSDDGDSQEEMDGETLVVHKGNIINGIRYSARVQEKQEKLRREASPSKQIIADSTTSPAIIVPCQSTTKVSIGEDLPEICPVENTFIPHVISMSGEKKKKRTWELWSQEDKQLFFEALNEFGKDFDAIQTYLASKLKPRSKGSCAQAVPKNKDQVRHFYYRTWNKISKYLTFPKDMKKAFQELYGLINYGELRKKQRVLSSKTAVKLSELVERGTTTIKVRGKTFRIKTPVCRALKRLNQLEDVDHVRIPCKLCVELIPHDGSTWSSIQRVSHNPRVKVYVPLQRSLASLIVYFEERWKTDESRLKEEFSLTMFGKPRTRLRFIPMENRDLCVPVYKFSETTSATKISLSAFVQNCLYQEQKPDAMLVSKTIKRKPKLSMDADVAQCAVNMNMRDSDYFAAETDASDVDGCEGGPENQFRITLRRDKTDFFMYGAKSHELYTDHDNSEHPVNFWSVHEENANAATETDAAETDYGFDENIPSPTECDDNTGDEDCMEPIMLYGSRDPDCREEKQCTCVFRSTSETEELGGAEKQERQCTCGAEKSGEIEDIPCRFLDSETIAKGWTSEEAGTITLGEIYLMIGKSDKLCFEYMWDKCEEDRQQEDRARNLVDKLVGVARHLKKKKTTRAKTSTSVGVVCNTAPQLCAKCNCKIESPGSVDGEHCSYISASVTKEFSEFPQFDSPVAISTMLQNSDSPEENKITLHAGTPSTDPDSPIAIEITKHEEHIVERSVSTKVEQQEAHPSTFQMESETVLPKKEELIGSPNTNLLSSTDSIISPDTISNPSNVCSSQPTIISQSGIVEISPVLPNSSNDIIDSTIIRTGPTITATHISASPTIIRSVAITTSCLTDSQKAALVGCHSTITPVATATTTVLVGEPLFAGIATEPASYVTIQQCTPATVTSITQVPQETKFRRPADVPILMKPCSDDRSTNEDGTVKLNVPKPFLDLPKGNRRIGRRPAWKQRVIIPRMLPLLPKPDESMMATLITLPPVVATGLSVVPVSAESLTSITAIPVTTDVCLSEATLVCPTVTLSSSVAATVSSTLTSVPLNTDQALSSTSLISTGTTSSLGTTSMKNSSSSHSIAPKGNSSSDKISPSKCIEDACLPSSSRSVSGFEETLDNLSLSSFMDISIPESTRFIASDLRLEELEYSNSSMSLGGMLDESPSKSNRDTTLLETPKKQNSNDSQISLSSPPSLTPLCSLDSNWPPMNEVG